MAETRSGMHRNTSPEGRKVTQKNRARIRANSMAARRLPSSVVAALDAAKILGIRAGTGDHRFIGIWVVVAEGRVFVRSYTRKPQSWWRTFLDDPRGEIQVGSRTIR